MNQDRIYWKGSLVRGRKIYTALIQRQAFVVTKWKDGWWRARVRRPQLPTYSSIGHKYHKALSAMEACARTVGIPNATMSWSRVQGMTHPTEE